MRVIPKPHNINAFWSRVTTLWRKLTAPFPTTPPVISQSRSSDDGEGVGAGALSPKSDEGPLYVILFVCTDQGGAGPPP